MRLWIVQQKRTAEAINEAINADKCKTEKQVGAIAAKYGDNVIWVDPNTVNWEDP